MEEIQCLNCANGIVKVHRLHLIKSTKPLCPFLIQDSSRLRQFTKLLDVTKIPPDMLTSPTHLSSWNMPQHLLRAERLLVNVSESSYMSQNIVRCHKDMPSELVQPRVSFRPSAGPPSLVVEPDHRNRGPRLCCSILSNRSACKDE